MNMNMNIKRNNNRALTNVLTEQSNEIIPPLLQIQHIVIIIINKCGQCNAGRERLTPISSRTRAPQYQHIEWKKRKEK